MADTSDDATDEMVAILRTFQTMQSNNARVSAAVAASLGIGPTDLRALLFLASRDGVTPKQMGDFMGLTSGAITNLVDRVVAAALVERVAHPRDRRSVMLVLAPGGEAAAAKVTEIYRAAFAEVVAPGEYRSLAHTFQALSDSLDRTAAAGPFPRTGPAAAVTAGS
jgi:DNA-binding MarR family transcriptional regulator